MKKSVEGYFLEVDVHYSKKLHDFIMTYQLYQKDKKLKK